MFGAGDLNAQQNSYHNPIYQEDGHAGDAQQQPQEQYQEQPLEASHGAAEEQPPGHQDHQEQAEPQQNGGSDQQQPSASGPSRPEINRDAVEGKVFLGGLSLQTSKDAVSEYCQQWGELADIVVMEGRGFGFVTFAEPKNAAIFLESKEHTIDGRRVEAKAAVPRSQAPSRETPTVGNKIFVGGTGDLTEDSLKEYFGQYGGITDCVIVRHPDGGSRGFGFVTFDTDAAVTECAGLKHTIGDHNVEVKRAVPREAIDAGGRGGPMRGRGSYGSYGGSGGRGSSSGYAGGYAGGYGGGYGGYGGGYGGYGGARGGMGGYGGYGAMGGMYGMGYPMSAMASMGGYGSMGMYGMGGMMGMGGYGMPASSAAMGAYGGSSYGGAGGASMRGGYAGAGGAGAGAAAGRYKPY